MFIGKELTKVLLNTTKTKPLIFQLTLSTPIWHVKIDYLYQKDNSLLSLSI